MRDKGHNVGNNAGTEHKPNRFPSREDSERSGTWRTRKIIQTKLANCLVLFEFSTTTKFLFDQVYSLEIPLGKISNKKIFFCLSQFTCLNKKNLNWLTQTKQNCPLSEFHLIGFSKRGKDINIYDRKDFEYEDHGKVSSYCISTPVLIL